MPLEINYYDINIHKLMLSDVTRCHAFRQGLFDVINPNSVVLDIGAGTGLLSIFAAHAGARRVYAVERTATAELARKIVAQNALQDRIVVIQGDMETVKLPEKVDVIVSEWLGGYGVDENLLPVIVQARDQWLKPGGKLIPGKVSSWIAPVYDGLLDKDVQSWREKPYNIELGAIADETFRQLRCCCNHIKPEHLLAEPSMMWEVDPHSISLKQAQQTFGADVEFQCKKSGRCNALATWFKADISEGNILSNEPSDNYTHWGRWVFPIGACVNVEPGTKISAAFNLQPKNIGQSEAYWQVEICDYSFSSADRTSLTR